MAKLFSIFLSKIGLKNAKNAKNAQKERKSVKFSQKIKPR